MNAPTPSVALVLKMTHKHHLLASALALTAAVHAQTNFTVVPSTFTATEGIGQLWLPGCGEAVRQQQILGSGLLQSHGLVGRTISAIEFRRSAMDRLFAGGAVNFIVQMGVAAHEPNAASDLFANNLGPAMAQVFQGQVTFPNSPALPAGPAAWSTDNIVRIVLQVPFAYVGGPLCIDVVGTPVAGQVVGVWPADAATDPAIGTTLDLGGGCGVYGGPQKRWSTVEARTLLPGGLGRFYAFGAPNDLALIGFGSQFPGGWPLSLALPNAAATCTMHLDLPVAMFLMQYADYANGHGRADYLMPIPNTAAVVGLGLTTQWVDLMQQASSNAIAWTVGSVPTMDMVYLGGVPADPVGNLCLDIAHVLRFEHN